MFTVLLPRFLSLGGKVTRFLATFRAAAGSLAFCSSSMTTAGSSGTCTLPALSCVLSLVIQVYAHANAHIHSLLQPLCPETEDTMNGSEGSLRCLSEWV